VGADIEVEFLGLALEQDRVVGERDREQHVRLYVLEPLNDRRHIREKLVVAFVIDELDVLLLGIGTHAVANGFSEGSVFP
jgi:hypothetical protein